MYKAIHSFGSYRIDTRRDHLIKVPTYLSGPICDACNDPMGDNVWLLVISLRAWGALCSRCCNEYHSKLPRYVLRGGVAVKI
jgi:hypothetical protein